MSSQRREEPLPEAREVARGVWKITLPIPFPLRTVNVYALVGNDGWVLVDAGMGTPAAREAFSTGLKRAGLDLAKLRALVLTHHHPDHIGLSGELQEQCGVPVYMHPIDEKSLRIIWDGTMPERFSSVSTFFRQHGLEPTRLWYTQSDPQETRRMLRVPPHEAFSLVEDGARLDLVGEAYRVLWVPGHSDGQIALFREQDGVFLSADHVLPRITPNVGLYSTWDRPDPLNDYLNSLHKVESLPASLVLPGHGEPFPDLARRVQEIVTHHEHRIQQILDLLAEQPRHAAWVTDQLFQGRLKNDEMRRMAMAEVLAHLEYMRGIGRVAQEHTAEDLILYTPAQ
jgi:glyoxylase-like metal-dependent hydrolase (beta-lactamase superfamily II)